MKLELKHLAPYLPYGLKMKVGIKTIVTITTAKTDNEHIAVEYALENKAYKPILKPLSDYCGETNLTEAKKKLNCSDEIVYQIWDLNSGSLSLKYVRVETYDLMCKNHIDFNRLIEKGLAIDINTIEK